MGKCTDWGGDSLQILTTRQGTVWKMRNFMVTDTKLEEHNATRWQHLTHMVILSKLHYMKSEMAMMRWWHFFHRQKRSFSFVSSCNNLRLRAREYLTERARVVSVTVYQDQILEHYQNFWAIHEWDDSLRFHPRNLKTLWPLCSFRENFVCIVKYSCIWFVSWM